MLHGKCPVTDARITYFPSLLGELKFNLLELTATYSTTRINRTPHLEVLSLQKLCKGRFAHSPDGLRRTEESQAKSSSIATCALKSLNLAQERLSCQTRVQRS